MRRGAYWSNKTMPKRKNKTKRTFKGHRPEYATEEYQEWVRLVKERDSNRCQYPGCRKSRFGMQVHHILKWANNPMLRYDVNNGVCLCEYHHTKIVTGNEELYVQLFADIVFANTVKQMNKSYG